MRTQTLAALALSQMRTGSEKCYCVKEEFNLFIMKMDFYRVVLSAKGGDSINSVLSQSPTLEAQSDLKRTSLNVLFCISSQVWIMIVCQRREETQLSWLQ